MTRIMNKMLRADGYSAHLLRLHHPQQACNFLKESEQLHVFEQSAGHLLGE